jgi:hypothetical protein
MHFVQTSRFEQSDVILVKYLVAIHVNKLALLTLKMAIGKKPKVTYLSFITTKFSLCMRTWKLCTCWQPYLFHYVNRCLLSRFSIDFAFGSHLWKVKVKILKLKDVNLDLFPDKSTAVRKCPFIHSHMPWFWSIQLVNCYRIE